MATRKLERTQWQTYFDQVSHDLGGKEVELEVAAPDIGAQIEAEWTPITGLSYDPKDDLLEVATDAIDHLIEHPQDIYVEDGVDGLHSVEIIDGDGTHQIIRLRSPQALPTD
jgi:hypothetical protein